jgi:hypothetical protein
MESPTRDPDTKCYPSTSWLASDGRPHSNRRAHSQERLLVFHVTTDQLGTRRDAPHEQLQRCVNNGRVVGGVLNATWVKFDPEVIFP